MFKHQMVIKQSLPVVYFSLIGLLSLSCQEVNLPRAVVGVREKAPAIATIRSKPEPFSKSMISLLPKPLETKDKIAQRPKEKDLFLAELGISGKWECIGKHANYTSPDAQSHTSKLTFPVKFSTSEILEGRFTMGTSASFDLLSAATTDKDPLSWGDISCAFEHPQFGNLKCSQGNSEQEACNVLNKMILVEPGGLFTPISYASKKFRAGYVTPKSWKRASLSIELPYIQQWPKNPNAVPPEEEGAAALTVSQNREKVFYFSKLRGDLKALRPVTVAASWNIVPEIATLSVSGGIFDFGFNKSRFKEICGHLKAHHLTEDDLLTNDPHCRGSGALSGQCHLFKSRWGIERCSLAFGGKYGHYTHYYDIHQKLNVKEKSQFFNAFNANHHLALQGGVSCLKWTALRSIDVTLGAGLSLIRGGEWLKKSQEELSQWKKDVWLLDRRAISLSISKTLLKIFVFTFQCRYSPNASWLFKNQIPEIFGFRESPQENQKSNGLEWGRLGWGITLTFKSDVI